MIEKVFYQKAKSDADLMAMLPGGVTTEWNTNGELPRAIVSYNFTNNVNNPVDSGSVSIDIFVRGNSVITVKEIAQKFVALFDRHLAYTDDTGNTVRFYYAGGGFVSEPDPQFTHYSLDFNVRYLRG